MLGDYAYIYKHMSPELKSLVLIGFRSPESHEQLTGSFLDDGNDFAYIDFSDWGDEEAKIAKSIYEEYVKHRLFKGRQLTFLRANEFSRTTKVHTLEKNPH